MVLGDRQSEGTVKGKGEEEREREGGRGFGGHVRWRTGTEWEGEDRQKE